MSSRWHTIAEALRREIQNETRHPGERLPTETELSVAWNVCRMTAHRALTELQREGLVERRRRVGSIVAARPSAGALRRTGQIAFVGFHTNDFPQIDILRGARAGLADNFDLLLFDSNNSGEREEVLLRGIQQNAAGVICYSTCSPEAVRALGEIAASGRPVVCVDRVPANLPTIDGIVTDNYGATRTALETLTARGHRRIAYITVETSQYSSVRERDQAFEDAMRSAGVENPESLVRRFPKGMGYDLLRLMDAVHEGLASLLAEADPPTAVFCLEDRYLASVLEACDRLGLSVPRDLEVVSFSDCPPMSLPQMQRVHRIVQRAFDIGRLASEQVVTRLSKQEETATASRIVRLAVDFFPATLPTDHRFLVERTES